MQRYPLAAHYGTVEECARISSFLPKTAPLRTTFLGPQVSLRPPLGPGACTPPPGSVRVDRGAQKRIASITFARTAMIAGSSPASAPTAVAASRPSIAAATGKAGTSSSG
jgi:hypothetical protein